MKRCLAIIQAILVAVAALIATSYSSAQDGSVPDFSKVTQVPREAADTWLKAQIKQSGGDWDTGRYSFYVGFSTGGFGTDPVSAIAMSRLAFGIMNNSLAVGDKITPIAWELTDETVGPTSTLSDDVTTRKAFVDNVPYAPRSDTRGGHDVDQTLYDTITKHILPANEQHSSIVLLLTTDDHSEAATSGNTHLFGSDNPLLLNALKSGDYRKPTHEPFKLGSKDGDRTVYIIGLFPKSLQSLPGSFGQRYPTFPVETWQPTTDRPGDPLPNKVKPQPVQNNTDDHHTPPQPPVEHHDIPWWAWLLLALLVVGVVLFMVLGKRSGVQRPLQPVAAAVAAPKIETIPGSLRISIGPDEQTLSPLIKAGTWALSRQADGAVKLVDTSKSIPGHPAVPVSGTGPAPGAVPVPETVPVTTAGTPLAKLSFGDDRTLHVDADSGAQFAELQGTAADKCDSRSLSIEPGKRILCRVQPPDAAAKTRFEVVYDTTVGKGSRV